MYSLCAVCKKAQKYYLRDVRSSRLESRIDMQERAELPRTKYSCKISDLGSSSFQILLGQLEKKPNMQMYVQTPSVYVMFLP
jgi:hypothetical protein